MHSEPSIEEILVSIRKVIERENRETAQAERQRRATEGLPRIAAELEQSEEPVAAPLEEHDILDLGDAAMEIVEEETILVEESVAEHSEQEPEANDTMRQSFAALAELSAHGSEAKPVDEQVQQMLRPMLAEWLDANLPELVERLVKEEIARIAGLKR